MLSLFENMICNSECQNISVDSLGNDKVRVIVDGENAGIMNYDSLKYFSRRITDLRFSEIESIKMKVDSISKLDENTLKKLKKYFIDVQYQIEKMVSKELNIKTGVSINNNKSLRGMSGFIINDDKDNRVRCISELLFGEACMCNEVINSLGMKQNVKESCYKCIINSMEKLNDILY